MLKVPLIGGVLLVAAYAASPGLALFRLDRAVRHGDVPTVARLVDWPAVRQGLAEEVAGGILSTPGQTSAHAGGTLPPFGFSFLSHVADHAIADRLTPRGLIRLAHADAGTDLLPAHVQLAGVWFAGPRQFTVRLRMTGQRRAIRLRLRLEQGGWKLDRVWLPVELLRRAAEPGGAAVSPRTADLAAPAR